jgi:hypothetical protein
LRSTIDQLASGLTLMRWPSASNRLSVARWAFWKRLRPVSQASKPVCHPQRAMGIGFGEPRRVGRDGANVGETEEVRQPAAVLQGFGEEPPGVEEYHRQVAVDFRDDVEEDGRIGAEARDKGRLAGVQLAGGQGDGVVGLELPIARVERCRLGGDAQFGIVAQRHGFKRHHRALP